MITVTKPLHFACDKKSTRYAFAGVQVTPRNGNQVTCAATNSRILAITSQEGTIDEQSIVPADCFKPKAGKFSTLVEKCTNIWKKTVSGKTVTNEEHNPIEGRFPRIDQVVPEAVPDCVQVTIDPELLLKLANALGRNDEKKGITLFIPTEKTICTGAVQAYFDGNSIGMIMPIEEECRLDGQFVQARKELLG